MAYIFYEERNLEICSEKANRGDKAWVEVTVMEKGAKKQKRSL